MAVLLSLLAVGCAAVPSPGERLTAEFVAVATPATIASSHPALRNALAHGVTPSDIAQGRLAAAWCAAQDGAGFRETWFPVRLPHGMRAEPDQPVLFRPGAERGGTAPPGEVVRRIDGAVALVQARAAGEMTVPLPRCDGGGEAGLQLGRLSEPFGSASLRFVQQEDAWLAALPAQALAAGRIVTLTCSPGAAETRTFLAELPQGLSVRRSDVVEAIAGVPLGHWPGPISRVTRVLPDVPEASLRAYKPNRFMVRCVPGE